MHPIFNSDALHRENSRSSNLFDSGSFVADKNMTVKHDNKTQKRNQSLQQLFVLSFERAILSNPSLLQ